MPDTVLLKGASLAKAVKEQVTAEAARLTERGVTPRLAVILASDDPSAASYVQSKQKTASSLGISVDVVNLGHARQEKLETTIIDLGRNPAVHGILLEFPLAAGLDGNR